MHLRQFTLTSVVSRLTGAPAPPSTLNIEPTPENANANAVIQVVTTILIIIMAFVFVISSLFFCFHRSIGYGCCGANDDDGEHDQHHEGRRRRTPGLSRAVIETFPTYLYSDVRVHRLGNGELECAVCLSEFKDVEILRLLPTCCHVFHPNCIDTWLMSRPTCPVCRGDVGSISNLTEHGGFRSMFGISSSDDGDPSIDIEQQSPVQIRSATPEAIIQQITRFQELNYPKSHSTGHSPAWTAEESDRFTLRLPDEVRNKLVTSGGRRGYGRVMGLMSSPRSWYRQRSVAIWCRRSNTSIKKQNYHRFKAGNVLDRFGEPVASSNVVVSSWSGSPKSDGPVDYSTLVNGRSSMISANY